MSGDVGLDVGALCLTAQRLAPRHQLYLAMPLRRGGVVVPGSYNQALSFCVRSQRSLTPQGQRQNACSNSPGSPAILRGATEGLTQTLSASQNSGSSLLGGMGCADAPLHSPSLSRGLFSADFWLPGGDSGYTGIGSSDTTVASNTLDFVSPTPFAVFCAFSFGHIPLCP